MVESFAIMASLFVSIAWLRLSSSRIWPRDNRLPDFSCGNTHANRPEEDTWGRISSLLSMDCMVWLLGRWTVIGGIIVVCCVDGYVGLM
jgi:hypothetical protein